jgi:CheY-like chemotaxis protein
MAFARAASRAPRLSCNVLAVPRWGVSFLDYRLPGMSGLELQRELQAQGRAIPINFVTAEDEALRLLQSEAGALAVVRKPFDPEALPRLVKVAVEARRRADRSWFAAPAGTGRCTKGALALDRARP